jgi:UDP-N-acetylmuramoyl-tripeptide--D-alanyl-D-alanine ligase
MKRLTIEEVATAIGAKPPAKAAATTVARVSTDSRDIQPGDLFFAIAGEQFNGHDFVDAALSSGAAFAVVSDLSRIPERWRLSGRLLVAADTIDALGRLAAYHRTNSAAAVIAVAGSNGKTTTKALILSILRTKKSGRAAPKSFNNHVGVPLTLLSVQPGDEFVVVEIGTNHPGEVARLAQLAQPDVGVITSIGEEHLEFLGDVEKVAEEEFSLLTHIRRRGMAVVPAEWRLHPRTRARDDLTIRTFGPDPTADLWASAAAVDEAAQRFKVNGRFDYALPAIGAHNVANALAAITVGLRFGMTHDQIAAALAAAELPPMRLELRRIGEVTLVNDAYNANPSSMAAALAALEQSQLSGRRVLVLGDMRELGPQAERCHAELGRAAGRSSAAVIVAVGAFSRIVVDGAIATAGGGKRTHAFPRVEDAATCLERIIAPGDVVLLKGSRAVRMERLIPAIETAAGMTRDRETRRSQVGTETIHAAPRSAARVPRSPVRR